MTTTTLDARGHAGIGRAPASRARAASQTAAARPGFLRRLWAGLEAIGRRRAEREVAAFIRSRGGRPTDSLERDIERYCALRGLR